MVKVAHDGVKSHRYHFILVQITASKFRILLTEKQWLLRLKRRLVVQTLGVTAPPPGLEEQQQNEEKEVMEKGMLQVTGLWGHSAEDAVFRFRIVCLLIK